jgi:thiamine-monophosphate kinase
VTHSGPLSEFELIDRFFRRPPRDAAVRIGIGDDAAIVAPAPGCELALSVDMLVEGRHFFAGTDPARLGHKTLAVNLSDMAAMGATPRFALLAGALPDNDGDWLEAFMGGFRALAEAHRVELVGGDTTRGPRNLCVTIVGEVPAGEALTRSGARAGDDIYVSGTIGDAALALAALSGRTMLDASVLSALRERLEAPQPRVELGIALRALASAAIDVSDGLTGDLGHILECSGVGARLDLEALPKSDALARKVSTERELALRCLLAGGDDYELCFTAPPSARTAIDALARRLSIALTRIGTITTERGLAVVEAGRLLDPVPRAFDHFA